MKKSLQSRAVLTSRPYYWHPPCSAEKRQSVHMLGSIEHLQHHFVSAHRRTAPKSRLSTHHTLTLTIHDVSDQVRPCVKGSVSVWFCISVADDIILIQ
jgi:hypothetical protein